MTKIAHIAWKELKTYFTSWMAYALLAGWLFLSGQMFVALLGFDERFELAPLYQNLIVFLLFIVPLITMRLLSEERSTGTLEMLFTSPLTEWQVTLGKYFGAWAFVGVLLLLTLHYPLFAIRYGTIDTGPIWGSYIALLCVGAAFVAFGLFCSSLTESQVVAGFLSFGGLVMSWLLSLARRDAATSDLAAFIDQWSILSHLEPMLRGAVDTKDLIYFASLTVLFLFATVRVLESRKWR